MKTLCRSIVVILALLTVAASGWCASPQEVAVIINDSSPISKNVGAYYVAKRKIPAKNVVHIKVRLSEWIFLNEYVNTVENPVKNYLNKTGLTSKINYLVLTKGVPIKVEGDWSLDGLLMTMQNHRTYPLPNRESVNPYFDEKSHFSYKKYHFYLATRLDGYTAADAKALVDRSLAAKPKKGLFLIDTTPQEDGTGTKWMNDAMKQAAKRIANRGYDSYLEDTVVFAANHKSLMGYFSWGSNDRGYTLKAYKSNHFLPGSIAETAVSTSARTFAPVERDKGQSVISDLIANGVTGVKGYVSEPYLTAIADPRILFDRYLSGYNLAESFYAASKVYIWRDIVVGDPLCAPYASK